MKFQSISRLTSKISVLDDESFHKLKEKIIFITGATSAGKSDTSMILARKINQYFQKPCVEIISADSVQVYQGLDIGANKPSLADREEIPHHLIDIYKLEPKTSLSHSSSLQDSHYIVDGVSGMTEPHFKNSMTTGDFARNASQAIQDILSRGNIPIVVGGSTMWVEWLLNGIPDAPKASHQSEDQAVNLLSEYLPERYRVQYFGGSDTTPKPSESVIFMEDQGPDGDWEAALAVLAHYDASRVATIPANNWYRLVRYLTIAIDQQSKPQSPSEAGRRIAILPQSLEPWCFFLNEDREELYRVLDLRCVQMVLNGLFEEVIQLIYQGKLHPSYAVIKSIGYRQAIQYLIRPRTGTKKPEESFRDFLL